MNSASAQLEASTDRATAIYQAGEGMNFLLRSSTYGEATYFIRPDSRSEILQQGTITLVPGQTIAVPFSMNKPEAVVLSLSQYGQGVKAAAVFSPYQIQPYEEEPADFDAFWNNAKAQLASIPLDPQVSYLTESPYSKSYRLSLGHIDGRRVYGYVSVPTGAGPFPAILTLPSAGEIPGVAMPETFLAEQCGAISVSITIHNAPADQQDPNAYQPDDFTDPNKNYYKYAVLAIVRAIDYIYSRPDFDGANVALTGVSQGGGLALMGAGADSRVKLLVQSNAALCQHSAYKYNSATAYPFYLWRSDNEIDSPGHFEATVSATKYYDAVYFARRFKGPSMHIIGYEDDVCPPATIFSAYNQVQGSQVLIHERDQGHTHTGAYWNGRFDFFRQHFPSTRNPPAPFASTLMGYRADVGDDLNLSNSTTTLNATVSLNELPLNNLEARWEKVSGPGTVNFATAFAYETNASFSATGTYVLRFSANDYSMLDAGGRFYTITDFIQVTVSGIGGDTTPPTVNLSTLSANINGPVSININFSEAINDLTISDFVLSNAVATNLSGTGANYSLTLNPTNEGTVLISLPANQVSDPAGNANIGSNQLFLNYTALDNTSPTATLAVPFGNVSSDFEVTVLFSEEVNDLTSDDFDISNGEAISLNGSGTTYSLMIRPQNAGQVTVVLNAGKVADAAGNPNTGSNQLFLVYTPIGDTTPPVLSLAVPSANVDGNFDVTIILTEAVLGLTMDDFSIVNGQALNLVGNDLLYTLSIQPVNPGEVLVSISGGKVSDAAGNPNPASNLLSLTYEPVIGGGDYCTAMGQQPWEQWIASMTFAEIQHFSFKESYGDFTALSSDVEQGTSYQLSLTPQFSGAQFNEYWRVWIDFNQDGDFYDAGEVVLEKQSSAVLNDAILIPNTASLGATRMRIAMKQGSYADPCETFVFGEVEDYSLMIVEGDDGGGNEEYCNAASQQPWDQWIAEVKVGDFAQGSGKATYTDFSYVIINLEQDNNYPVTLTPGYSWQTYNEFWTIWIDFNQDKDFNDPGELVFSNNGRNAINGNIQIPAEVQTGQTRMRVAMKRNGYADPCETFVLGEVEDFTVDIAAGTGGGSQDYCDAMGLQPWEQWISRVSFASIDQSSFKDQYADFTNLNADVKVGTTHFLQLQPGYSGEAYQVFWRVWIDLNRDGIFGNDDELIYENSGNNLVQSTIEIPNHAVPGKTRMRVAMQRNFAPAPCGDLTYGEVEDYSLTILPPSASNRTGQSPAELHNTDDVILLFPNPSHGAFSLDMSAHVGQTANIELIDFQGRRLKQFSYEDLPSTPLNFRIQDYSEGVYFLKIKVGDKPFILKKVIFSGR